MFTTPLGFNDHEAVVLQFVGLGLSGRQPNKWKFPLEALRDPEVVDWMAAELAEVEAQGHQGLAAFEASYDVLRAGSSLYYSRNPPVLPCSRWTRRRRQAMTGFRLQCFKLFVICMFVP